MKRIICIMFVTMTFMAGFAQKESSATKDLKKIWLSNDADGVKAHQVKAMKLKEAEMPLADIFAATLITFRAEQNKDAGVRLLLQRFETLPPAAKTELDNQYAGIVAAYEDLAKNRSLATYQFSAELNTSLSLKEIDKRSDKSPVEPAFYVDRMRFYTTLIQRELYESRNIVIAPTWKQVVNLWSSLTQGQKDSLDQLGYPNFWKEQIGLYNHKFSNKSWACTCGTEQSTFSNLPECGEKILTLNQDEKNLDKPTLVLIQLTNGNLAVVSDAMRDPTLSTYSGSRENIVRQLCFLHLSAISGWKLNSGMKISLVSLWDKGETNGSNDYVKRIGLTRDELAGLETYYTCILGIKSLAPSQTKQTAPVEKDSLMIPKPIIKEAQHETVQTAMKIPKGAGIASLQKAWDRAVQNELKNRENLFLCAETRIVNDSTIELDLRGCGDGKGTFKVLEVETPLVGEFFNYSTNVLSDLLIDYKHNASGRYEIIVTGTADTLSYSDNQGLADQRANFVKAHLGKKLLADCPQSQIRTVGLINQTERKVTLRVIIHRPR